MTSPIPTLAVLGLLGACSTTGLEQITDTNASDESTTASLETSATATTSNVPTTGTTQMDTGLTDSSVTTSGTLSTSTSDTTSDSGSDSSTGDTTGATTLDTTDTSTGDTTAGSSSTGEPDGCSDGQKNGDETDIDCGGAVCDPCVDDQACIGDPDCLSGSCMDGLCVAASCADLKQDGDETDIDCGGVDCDPCPEGKVCELGDDCQSGVCDTNLCLPPACDDTVTNGVETDVDCGGAECDPCAAGLDCALPADCQSGVCSNTVCDPATCNDGVLNGMETAIDCGGNNCAPCQLANLTINEVDYDSVGDDLAEFIEIYNNTGATVDLTNIHLVLVNGTSNATYLDLGLAAGGMLLQGQYLVVGPAALVTPPGAVKVDFAKAKDNVQNGIPSPDGIALVDTANMKLLDALSYEGPMTMATVTGLGVVSLVEGMALDTNVQDSTTEQRSLIRFPNGNDKDNAATDWVLSTTPTPGAPNLP